ncbi:hypothetical protein KJ059_12685 [Myxococcota bacterium]|nr:hypothetical protein [Myxococcota bacterium]MCZ7619601.1 hypothetical protein [Myxococcota bacterium]
MNGVSEASRPTERRDARRRRSAWVRKLAIAWLLGVAAATSASAAGSVLERSGHACCAKSPARASVPTTPCQALLPLLCCDGTTLPAVAPAAPDRSDAAITAIPACSGTARDPATLPLRLRRAAAASPRSSPLALSVVLRL